MEEKEYDGDGIGSKSDGLLNVKNTILVVALTLAFLLLDTILWSILGWQTLGVIAVEIAFLGSLPKILDFILKK